MSEAEKRYQLELEQSEKDHKKPTAGAMVGHIISNLHIQQNKLRQINYYLKKNTEEILEIDIEKMLAEEAELFNQLNQLMLDEGEVIPTTSEEFIQYSMLKENGQLKYESSGVMLLDMGKDFETQNLFITRGITLSEKENKYALTEFLKHLYGWVMHQLFLLKKSGLPEHILDQLDEE